MNPIDTLGALAQLARSPARPVPSPCISVCRMDPESALCQGCFRTIDEIIAWSRQGDAERRGVWQRVVQRAGLQHPSPAAPPPT